MVRLSGILTAGCTSNKELMLARRRNCLGNCMGQNLHSTEIAEMLNTIALTRPLPQLLKTDNGLNLREKYWTNGNMSEGAV